MLDVRLLGQFDVQHDGMRLTIPTRNAQTLFAYLILNAGKMNRREKLAGMLWPDSSEDNARSNLRHELWRLRKALQPGGASYFQIDDLAIAFNPHSPYTLDVQRLESAPLDGNTADGLIQALSDYHGQLLPGFYEDWILSERDRLHALFESRISRLLDMLQTEGRWEEVLHWSTRWIALEQWSEPAYRALITAYANTGDISRAAATYERFSLGLQKDLGVEPSEQTRALVKRLKAGWKLDPSHRSPPDSPTLKIRPESVPPVVPLPRVRRSNLPQPLTSFIGREKEMQQVEQMVSQARLVTITGAGGVGKTRLAIQVAGGISSLFQDGVWWVELASISGSAISQGPDCPPRPEQAPQSALSPPVAGQTRLDGLEQVTLAVAKALRIPETPGLSTLDGIVETLQNKELLLVLDNCEHLIGACAALVEQALGACPHLVILATSREALGLPGELAWALPSLSLPAQGSSVNFNDILQSEAVSLFIERAAGFLPAYRPDPQQAVTIAQICLRLDGIPLAIELAAARMRLLSVQEIAARLDSRFSLLTGGRRTSLPRHQTLFAAIEWSYDLLAPAEQALFRRLSVFAGSFTLEAAEAACADPEIPAADVLTLVGRLVDKSLLTVEPAPPGLDLPTRYRFLDTIHSFGRLNLERAGETGWMRSRHAAYYVRLVETAEPELLLHNQGCWFRLLQAERDNLYAVVEWSAESDQAESALRLVGALLWFWFSHGSTRAGRDFALKALALPSALHFKQARARALNTAGFLLCLLKETAQARRLLEEALAIHRTFDDQTGLSWSLQFLGLVLAYDQEYDLADAAFKEGLELSRKLSGANASTFLHFWGDIDLQKGDPAGAGKMYQESARILREIGNKYFLAYPLRRLGYLALEQDDLPEARGYFLESLRINLEIGDNRAVAACLVSLALLAVRLEKPLVAARLYGVVENRLESLSLNLLYLDQLEHSRLHTRLLLGLDEDAFLSAFSAGWEMGEQQVLELVGEIIA
jgi:predicted ATPase/DNA-binding SARP family transcriptional activator